MSVLVERKRNGYERKAELKRVHQRCKDPFFERRGLICRLGYQKRDRCKMGSLRVGVHRSQSRNEQLGERKVRALPESRQPNSSLREVEAGGDCW